jgi:YD repeat-containing protein
LLNDGVDGYLYDDENRVAAVNIQSGGQLLYSYDAAGQRIRKSNGGTIDEYVSGCGIGVIAPHDLRRTCARLCHQAGGELEQIQFLLGHVSIQTTERYLGCKQRLRNAVNDKIGLEPPEP